MDREVIDLLEENMRKLGIQIKLNTPFKSVNRNDENGKLTVVTESGEKLHTDKILVAIGRPSNTKSLNLEVTGVTTDKKGSIVVDEHMFTNVPGIYAIGDVTNTV